MSYTYDYLANMPSTKTYNDINAVKTAIDNASCKEEIIDILTLMDTRNIDLNENNDILAYAANKTNASVCDLLYEIVELCNAYAENNPEYRIARSETKIEKQADAHYEEMAAEEEAALLAGYDEYGDGYDIGPSDEELMAAYHG